ncbi:MAG: M16 family metallopeptidase, partial [Thermoanaerobaculia bacterium]
FYEWPSPKEFSKDDAPLDILAAILASDKNSRLYKRLVYDMQVVQSVRASQQSLRLASTFEIDVTPKPGQSLAAIDKVINEEINRLMTEKVTEREIDRAKNSYRSSFLNRIASVHGKADLLNRYNYLAGTPDYVQKDAARYDAVTREDVQRVARTYLGQHKLVLTVVPEGKRDLALTGNGGEQ